MEERLVQVRGEGGLGLGNSSRGRGKWTDMGCIWEAYPIRADDGLNRERLLLHALCPLHSSHCFVLLLKHSRHAVLPRS